VPLLLLPTVRAKNLDIITQNQYQYLMKQLSQKGYRTAEPFDKETPLIKPRYIKQAMKMILNLKKMMTLILMTTMPPMMTMKMMNIVE
jgi:Zn-dependent peptidase ImmA (M78 family)